MEKQIISAVIQSKQCYDLVRDCLDPSSFSPESAAILHKVDDFYSTDQKAQYCDLDLIRSNLLSDAPSGAMKDQLSDFLDAVTDCDVSLPNIVRDVLSQRQRACGHKLAQAILTGSDKAVLNDLVNQYSEAINKTDIGLSDDEEYISPDIASLVNKNTAVKHY